MRRGVELIFLERERQIIKEGYTAAHDDLHTECELAVFAACYALDVAAKTGEAELPVQAKYAHAAGVLLPFDRRWWKPELDPVKQLTKAGALIAAEIDRLQRKEVKDAD